MVNGVMTPITGTNCEEDLDSFLVKLAAELEPTSAPVSVSPQPVAPQLPYSVIVSPAKHRGYYGLAVIMCLPPPQTLVNICSTGCSFWSDCFIICH